MADSEWTAAEADRGTRLDKFLAGEGRLGSRAKAFSAIERGKVFLNGAEADVPAAATKLAPGDVVRVWMDRPGSARPKPRSGIFGDLDIVYEDDALIVVHKPAGLLSVPLERRAEAASVFDQLEDHFRPKGKRRPLVVHRIDRDTSGLVVFAKHASAQLTLKAQFKAREPERVYLAIVYGHPDPSAGIWRDYLAWDTKLLIQKETSPSDPDGYEAICRYRTVESFAETSLLEVRLETGKRNQIRIQARLRGHTLVGEQRYVYGPDSLRPIDFGRQALHAWRLAFVHPSTGKPVEFEAPIPRDMQELLTRLRR
jgi:23S rRNA pseudouridine1911/1915/1917 synthase